jgi:DNA-binding CsgD family transcriptional regulator
LWQYRIELGKKQWFDKYNMHLEPEVRPLGDARATASDTYSGGTFLGRRYSYLTISGPGFEWPLKWLSEPNIELVRAFAAGLTDPRWWIKFISNRILGKVSVGSAMTLRSVQSQRSKVDGGGVYPDGAWRRGERSFDEFRGRIRVALSQLSLAKSPEEVRMAVPLELAQACGFTRVMLSAVWGSRWVPLHFYSRPELDPRADIFQDYVSSDPEIALANLLAETNMARRRAAVLVDELLVNTRAAKEIIEASHTRAYVAAPVVVQNRAIGFLHADRVGQDRAVDERDRRLIEAFSSGFAVVYEHVVRGARLAKRRAQTLTELDRARNALTTIGSELGDLPFGLLSSPAVDAHNGRRGEVDYSLLTAREWEVLGHIAAGGTNRIIAHRLSLSEETIKSHVRSLLRKLKVTTRAGAVARYVELKSQVPR